MSSELEQLRAEYEEFKRTTAAVDDDLAVEVSSLEQALAKKTLQLEQTEQAFEQAKQKAEIARAVNTRQQLSLEKQIQAFELSIQRMTDDRRKLEQQKDDIERTHRVLQNQSEQQAELCETLVEREVMLRTELEELEFKSHHNTLEHDTVVQKLKAAFKMLYSQLKRLKQAPAIGLPGATPEEQAEMDEECGDASPRPSRKAFENKVQMDLIKQLNSKLATALTELEQAQLRIRELEAPQCADMPPPADPEFKLAEGFLVKRTDGTLASWKRQLFKINTETHTLEFFFLQNRKGDSKRIKLGEIPLAGASITVAVKEGSHDNLFHIKPRFSKKTYVLQAGSAEERNMWLTALSAETEARAKIVADSLCEGWLKVEKRGRGWSDRYCVLRPKELQLFKHETDGHCRKAYSLLRCSLGQAPADRPHLVLEIGPKADTRVVFDCGTAETLAEWTSGLQRAIEQQSFKSSSVSDEPSLESKDMDGDTEEFPLKGSLRLFDPSTRLSKPFYFEISEDANFLDYYPSPEKGGLPAGSIPLLSTRQGGTSTAIVSSYPAGVYLDHNHVFGITPPFSSMTRLLEASSREELLNWMDGLVTLLDGKVARDPYSTKEGYLYKGFKDSTKWGKRYVIVSVPDFKYYKPGRHTNPTVLILSQDSQIVLQPATKKFPTVFSLQEGVGTREFLWASKNQAFGEAWVTALQAAITKLRSQRRMSIAGQITTPHHRGRGSIIHSSPSKIDRCDSMIGSFTATPDRSRDDRRTSGNTVATFVAFSRHKSPSDDFSAAGTPTIVSASPQSASSAAPACSPLAHVPTPSAPSSASSPLATQRSFTFLTDGKNNSTNLVLSQKRATLHMLKSGLFTTAKWVPIVVEVNPNGRSMTYFEPGTAKKNWILTGAHVEVNSQGQFPGHECTFSLSGSGGPALVLETADAKERTDWVSVLKSRVALSKYMFADSAMEGLLAMLKYGQWKEKYFVVRQGRLECYNRANRKRAWEMALTASTQARAEPLSMRNQLVCSNADTPIDPGGVFTVLFDTEKLVLGTHASDRDCWIEAVHSNCSLV